MNFLAIVVFPVIFKRSNLAIFSFDNFLRIPNFFGISRNFSFFYNFSGILKYQIFSWFYISIQFLDSKSFLWRLYSVNFKLSVNSNISFWRISCEFQTCDFFSTTKTKTHSPISVWQLRRLRKWLCKKRTFGYRSQKCFKSSHNLC